MAKKHWISVKRGLSEDPKHREKMGMSVWAFLHIIDRADWETGTVFDWRDKDEAEDMGVNERTLRDWRQKLAEEGYIRCDRTGRGLNVLIFNWINPKDYGSAVVNDKRASDTTSDILVSLTDGPIDTTIDTTISGKSVSPTLLSNIKTQKEEERNVDHPAFKALAEAAAGIWPRDDARWRDEVRPALMQAQLTWDVGPEEESANGVTIRRPGTFIVVAGLGMKAAMMQDRYAATFERALVGVLGRPIKVRFEE